MKSWLVLLMVKNLQHYCDQWTIFVCLFVFLSFCVFVCLFVSLFVFRLVSSLDTRLFLIGSTLTDISSQRPETSLNSDSTLMGLTKVGISPFIVCYVCHKARQFLYRRTGHSGIPFFNNLYVLA